MCLSWQRLFGLATMSTPPEPISLRRITIYAPCTLFFPLASFVRQIFGSAGLAYATAALTVTTLFFGELLPKALGVNNAEIVARRVLPIIIVLSVVLNPVAKTFTLISSVSASVGVCAIIGLCTARFLVPHTLCVVHCLSVVAVGCTSCCLDEDLDGLRWIKFCLSLVHVFVSALCLLSLLFLHHGLNRWFHKLNSPACSFADPTLKS